MCDASRNYHGRRGTAERDCYDARLQFDRMGGLIVLDILMAGGWAMLPILICSAIALAIVLERCWTLRRKSVLPPGLGDEVRNWARSGQLDPGHLATLANGSPLGELLAAALAVRNRPRELIKERIEDTGRHVVHNMERYLNTLGTIALIGPLLGLLGTVVGLIRMFLDVMKGGVGDPLKMAGGIGEALICTATGLVVAIPAYVLHRYFRSRVAGYCVEMEKQATALLDELTVAAPAPSRPRRAAESTAG
ncbi:biopolymer transport protein ExbB [Dyella marensis]|jgi:biopolymer transport protein ExbB|uniref:Biopolymer transport protein ExbB n=2 Tax=Rhodanobacteraceae TaxID=1775411 RepID=A0A1I1Y440_9GAMM|nr:biopolymer transport protein ExbB [Dyella marensis]